MFLPDITIDQLKEATGLLFDKASDFQSLADMISEKTINHALKLFLKCGKNEYFGRTKVEDITGLKSTRASELIKLLVDSEVIVPVTGCGKGKYRFQ